MYGRSREQLKRDRKRVGIEDEEELILEVAKRQALRLELDKQKQFEELERELQIHDIQLNAEHLEALNFQRERLINAEIGLRIRQKLQDEEIMTLLLIAAMVS